MFRASSLLSTSTTIHALCTPSQQPKSAWVKKCEPVSRSTLAARAHATTSDSCGTSMRNLAMRAVCCWASEKSNVAPTQDFVSSGKQSSFLPILATCYLSVDYDKDSFL